MPLQAKFLLLIGTLLMAVLASLVAAGTALQLVQTQVARPLEQTSVALGELGRIKRAIEDVRSATGPGHATADAAGWRDSGTTLPPRAPAETELAMIASATAAARDHIASLERNEWYLSRIGISTWTNIKHRVGTVTDGSLAWAREGREDARAEARRAAFEVHELIEKTELRILEDSRKAVGFSASFGTSMSWWLAAVALAAGLISMLGVFLLRRWVQQPVADLRLAAARIAAGDFTHRVAVSTGDEIGQLMREVNHMAGMVDRYQREAIDRERLAAVGQMVRRIVHNVRNPLAGIRGLAEVTRMDAPEGSEERENLSLIVSTVDTFERWLSQLLESTGPMDLRPARTALAPLLESVLRSHETGARAKGVALKLDLVDGGLEADLDPRHMEHAIAALVANAIDASPRGGTVFVRTRANGDANTIEVVVCDEGPGVPEPLRERIFEPHFTTKPHGTGIGLALAQQIARSHGGSISLDSPENDPAAVHGACFRLRWPRVAKDVHREGG